MKSARLYTALASTTEAWPDEHQRWQWRWAATELQSARGFWALGEAVVDAVATRYPAAFDRQASENVG